MASPLSIALRKTAALKRLEKVLKLDTVQQGRDALLNEAILLERIADAVEAMQAKAAKALESARSAAPVDVPAKLPKKAAKHDD